MLLIEHSEPLQVTEEDKTDSLYDVKYVAWARLEIFSYAELARCGCIIYRKYCNIEKQFSSHSPSALSRLLNGGRSPASTFCSFARSINS